MKGMKNRYEGKGGNPLLRNPAQLKSYFHICSHFAGMHLTSACVCVCVGVCVCVCWARIEVCVYVLSTGNRPYHQAAHGCVRGVVLSRSGASQDDDFKLILSPSLTHSLILFSLHTPPPPPTTNTTHRH